MSSAAIRRFVSKAVPPVGPYSSAVLANGTLYVSGCIGIDASATLTSTTVEGQARQALENMRELLTMGGATFDDVVKTTILLRSMDDFAAVNAVYASFFTPGHVRQPPAPSAPLLSDLCRLSPSPSFRLARRLPPPVCRRTRWSRSKRPPCRPRHRLPTSSSNSSSSKAAA
jgi:2-iminobutanoate/2-iminopropanoate deaminase